MVARTLTQKRSESLSPDCEREQAELEQTVAQLKAEPDGFKSDADRAERFIEIVKRHTDITALTPALLSGFIEKRRTRSGQILRRA